MKQIFAVLISLLFLFLILPTAYAENEANYTVYGQVFDTDGVTPVNGATVTITVSGSSLSSTTTYGTRLNGSQVNGYYYFPALPVSVSAGTSISLSASISGKTASTTVAKAASEPQRVDLTLSTGGSGGTSSGSGGSGGGGGGGSTGEEYSNIVARESRDEVIGKDMPTKYAFSTASSPVYELTIISNINAGLINAQLEVLKGRSKLSKEDAPGTPYKYINVWVGTSGYATPKNIKDATIKFRVETSWIESGNYEDTDIVMMRWDGTKWDPLETQMKNKDSTLTYFEAKTNAFSPFVITSLKGTAVETATPEVTGIPPKPAETATSPIPATTKKTAGFEVVLAIVAIFAIWRYRR